MALLNIGVPFFYAFKNVLFPDIHVRQDRHGYFSCVASGSIIKIL